MDHAHNDRYTRGWDKLKEIDGSAGEHVIAALAPIAPDFGRLLIEFGFGDIYSRPQLDLRAREIATIASLATLGCAKPQLKVHIEAALNVRCTREEIVEVFMQMALYAGFPAALNALFAAHEIFERHDQASKDTQSERAARVEEEAHAGRYPRGKGASKSRQAGALRSRFFRSL